MFPTATTASSSQTTQDYADPWGAEQQKCLDDIRAYFCNNSLALRRIDYSKPLILHTDWSKNGMGAVLSQEGDDGKEYMCACASRSLSKAERNYSSFEGEMAAVVYGICTFQHHLMGLHFTLYTDHQPLTWLMKQENLEGKHARWNALIQMFRCTVRHRPGANGQAGANMLSRLPRDSSEVTTPACLEPDLPPTATSPVQESPASVSAALAVSASLPVARHGHNVTYSLVGPHAAPAIGVAQGNLHALYHAALSPTSQQQDTSTPPFPHPTHPAAVAMRAFARTRYNITAQTVLTANDSAIDAYAPVMWVAHYDDADSGNDPAQLRQLQRMIAHVRQQALAHRQSISATPTHPTVHLCKEGEPDSHGIYHTSSINTAVLGPQYSDTCPLVVWEPFGGLGAGLDTLLRAGHTVKRYLYSDIDPAARAVMRERLHKLSARYPQQLPPEAWRDAFTTLPQDVARITPSHLVQAGAAKGEQWFVIAGWECQDLSPAGSGQGLAGKHSSTFYSLVNALGYLQQLQPAVPPAYIIENVAMQRNFNHSRVRESDYQQICSAIGTPVVLDAQFGSYAHRVRNAWINLADTAHLRSLAGHVHRLPGRSVTDVLEPFHSVRVAAHSDRSPQYPVNRQGQPLQVLPTIVAYSESHAFKPGQHGSLLVQLPEGQPRSVLEEPPSVHERERIMGYPTNDTVAPGVSDAEEGPVPGRSVLSTLILLPARACTLALPVVLGSMSSANRSHHQQDNDYEAVTRRELAFEPQPVPELGTACVCLRRGLCRSALPGAGAQHGVRRLATGSLHAGAIGRQAVAPMPSMPATAASALSMRPSSAAATWRCSGVLMP